ncbi:MAG: phosphoenolpyruvate hydrolase family protein [Acidimicrobiia bacterium]|nr:phosphoenolpyruvate hydrolase family protein [Acidimicrobiia bacterium]MYF84868.1 phosphoenolpyruvate hydrolase family protein [Acidimicrobiia bacterium]
MRREAILEALHRRIATGQAVLAAGCSAGIIARSAEEAGADLIVVYSTGRSRLMGLPTWRFGDSNQGTLEMSSEILNVVSDTPVIGGIEANDPTRRDLGRLLDRFEEAGFSGVINFPTLTNMPDQRRRAQMVGYGFGREVEAVRLARSRSMFTMAYVASADDAARMAAAGADCVVTHSGPTTGGRVGYSDDRSVEAVCAYAQSLIDAAVAANPDVIPLLHGGRLATPDDVREALPLTTAVGFVGASSIERIPVERAVRHTVRAFRNLSTGSEQR